MHQSVLLIEDDPVLEGLIKALALPCDLNITQAINGFDGLKLASSQKFDLIFVDLMLPQVDGLDVIRLLKWHPVSQGSRLIAISRAITAIQRNNTLAAGADFFLQQPFSTEEIIAALNKPAPSAK